MNTSTRTVREVALELPQATRVFEKLKIDYCCGGNVPLGQACSSAGVDIDDVMKMLEEAGQSEKQETEAMDFQHASLTQLIGYIHDKHHVYTKHEMTRLESLIWKVIGAHGKNHPELSTLADQFQRICADLKPHMFKEEQVLFPYIVELERSVVQEGSVPTAPFGTVNNPIHMMMMEHDAAGDLLRELRQTSSNYTVPADGCISYSTLYEALEAFELDLHQHIHLENNILFPRAIEMEKKL
jgi:regulator of cell morphogenesis and NO signaling